MLKKFQFLFFIFLFIFISQNLFSGKIIWEKYFDDDTLTDIGLFSKIKNYNDSLFVVFSGLNQDSIYNNGIIIMDFNGNIKKRNHFLSNRNNRISNFQLINKQIQIYTYDIDKTSLGSKTFFMYVNNNLELIETTQLSKYTSIFSARTLFVDDSVYNMGERTAGMDKYDGKMNYLGYSLIDTSGFNYISNIHYPESFFSLLSRDNNLLWIIPQRNSKGTIYSFVLCKTDKQCNKIFISKYPTNNPSSDNRTTAFYNLTETSDNSIIMVGYNYGYIPYTISNDVDSIERVFGLNFVKYDKNGNFLWEKKLELEHKLRNYSYYNKVTNLSNDNFVLCGYNLIGNTLNFSYLIFNSNADLIDSCSWSNGNYCILNDIIEKDNGNILVFGYSLEALTDSTDYDWLYLAEIGYQTSVKENEQVPDYLKIAPNPATERVTVEFDFEGIDLYSTKIELFNMLGSKIKDVEEHIVFDGNNSKGKIDFSVSGLPAGMYFIKIGNKVQKFVKM